MSFDDVYEKLCNAPNIMVILTFGSNNVLTYDFEVDSIEKTIYGIGLFFESGDLLIPETDNIVEDDGITLIYNTYSISIEIL